MGGRTEDLSARWKGMKDCRGRRDGRKEKEEGRTWRKG
jgi:hypothetical protein